MFGVSLSNFLSFSLKTLRILFSFSFASSFSLLFCVYEREWKTKIEVGDKHSSTKRVIYKRAKKKKKKKKTFMLCFFLFYFFFVDLVVKILICFFFPFFFHMKNGKK